MDGDMQGVITIVIIIIIVIITSLHHHGQMGDTYSEVKEKADGEWHLVMELAEGGELFERLLNHGAAASAEERASRRQRPRRGLSVLCRRVLGAGRVAAARPGERV